jgi:hypothetical protein
MSVNSQFGSYLFQAPFSKDTFTRDIDSDVLVGKIDPYWSQQSRAITGVLCSNVTKHPQQTYLSICSLFDRFQTARPEEFNSLISSALIVSLCGGDSFTQSIQDMLNQRCLENLGSMRWQIASDFFDCIQPEDFTMAMDHSAFKLLIIKAVQTHQDSYFITDGSLFQQRKEGPNKYEELFQIICETSPYLYSEMCTHLQEFFLAVASQFETNGTLADSVARLFTTVSGLHNESREEVIDGLYQVSLSQDLAVSASAGRVCRRIEEAFGHESDFINRFRNLLSSSSELTFKEKRRLALMEAEFSLYNPKNAQELISRSITNTVDATSIEELCVYAGAIKHIISSYKHLLDGFLKSDGFTKIISFVNHDSCSSQSDSDPSSLKELANLVLSFYQMCSTEQGIENATIKLLEQNWLHPSIPLGMIESVTFTKPHLSRGILRGFLSVIEEKGCSLEELVQLQDTFLTTFTSNPLLQEDFERICVVMSDFLVDPTCPSAFQCIASEILEKARESRELLVEVCHNPLLEDGNLS